MINLKKITKNDLKKIRVGLGIQLILPKAGNFNMEDGLYAVLAKNKNIDEWSILTGVQPGPDLHSGVI